MLTSDENDSGSHDQEPGSSMAAFFKEPVEKPSEFRTDAWEPPEPFIVITELLHAAEGPYHRVYVYPRAEVDDRR